MKNINEKTINASNCDVEAKLSIIGALHLIQDNVTDLMKKLNIDGPITMKKYNAMWVYTKNVTKFYSHVKWNDVVTIESFISLKSSVKIVVDTYIKNLQGEILVFSKIEECPISLLNFKIIKVSDVGLDNGTQIYNSYDKLEFSRFDGDNCTLLDSVKVKSTNIDFCHHTNNVEYLRFLLDTYSVEQTIKMPIKVMQIDYVNQSFENDILDIYKRRENKKDYFVIKKENQIVIKSKFEF